MRKRLSLRSWGNSQLFYLLPNLCILVPNADQAKKEQCGAITKCRREKLGLCAIVQIIKDRIRRNQNRDSPCPLSFLPNKHYNYQNKREILTLSIDNYYKDKVK